MVNGIAPHEEHVEEEHHEEHEEHEEEGSREIQPVFMAAGNSQPLEAPNHSKVGLSS